MSNQGLVNFVVTVEVDDADASAAGHDRAVNVVVNQLEDVLLVPNRAVRNRDGNQVIYCLEGRPAAARGRHHRGVFRDAK